MEWWIIFLILFSLLILLFASGIPIAFGFLFANIIGIYFFMRGISGLQSVTLYIYSSIASFTLMPVPLFILMGEVLFNTGVTNKALDALDKWIGHIPGRLSLLAIIAGVLFAILSGSSIASAATLGALLVPEMRRRNYSKQMAIGPILASGQLAVIIPPSILIIILGSLADISIGKLLIGGVIPGIMLGGVFFLYFFLRAWSDPLIAPPIDEPSPSFYEKIISLARYVLPLFSIVILVLGLIFLGIATPSESSAIGAVGSFIIALFYRKLNIKVIKKSVVDTARTSATILLVLSGSMAFSQLLSYVGASRGFVNFAVNLPVSPLIIVMGMIVVTLILGTFLDQISIMMVAAPIFMPVIRTLGFEPVWFAIVLLIAIELGVKTPPFGLLLFVMKGVSPKDISMGDIYKSSFPIILIEIMFITFLVIFPKVTLWLPNYMK